MSTITCGNRARHAGQTGTHGTVAAVRACYLDPDTFTCGWQYEARDRYGVLRDEDGQVVILECQSLAWSIPNGITCESGHEHFFNREYTDDRDEAMALAKVGVEALDPQGRVWV
jgi:hypothetical protein